MRFSPFPPGHPHPWRDALRFAGFGVWLQIRSPWWWFLQLGLPLGLGLVISLTLIGSRLPDVGVPDIDIPKDATLWVTTDDPSTERALQDWLADDPLQWATFRVATGEPPEDAAVLRLRGALPGELTADLVASDAALGRRLHPEADWLVGELWRRAAMSEDEVSAAYADPDVGPDAEVEGLFDLLTSQAMGAAPAILGVLGALSAFGAGGLAAGAVRSRDEGAFGMLRVGTPASVLFVGSLVERATLTLLGWLPWMLVLVPLVAFLSVVTFVAGMAMSVGWLAVAPVVLAGIMSTCTGVGAGLGALIARPVAPGAQAPPGGLGGLILPVAMLGAYWGYPRMMAVEGAAAWAVSVLPVVGLPLLTREVVTSGVGVGVVLCLCVHALAAIGAIRVGAWAFGQDEGGVAELRRRWRVRWAAP